MHISSSTSRSSKVLRVIFILHTCSNTLDVHIGSSCAITCCSVLVREIGGTGVEAKNSILRIAPVGQPEVGGDRGTVHAHREENSEEAQGVGACLKVGNED